MRRKSERARSERESDITLKLECVKLAQRALPEAFSEIMFAFQDASRHPFTHTA